MSGARALQRLAGPWRNGRWRPGVQLAAAVAIAWCVATALHLPESFWAVMSVLIVMRPSAGSTLDAGWDRVRGTAAGALVGLAGVYLQHHGAPALATTLALVVLLAFASASVPGMRSAPVAALIILSAGGIPGHTPLQVALLRMVQIGIGVGVALAVSTVMSEYHAGVRFDEGCAALLRGIAKRMSATKRPVDAVEIERIQAGTRAALARLSALAGSADLEARWWRRGVVAGATGGSYRDKARLAARIFQDATMLDRVLRLAPGMQADAAQAAGAAIAGMADALAGKAAPPDLGELGRCAAHASSQDSASSALLAAPLNLLLDDLRRLQGALAMRPPG
ncbi:FUSC family protein [Variovorax sp. W6]|uniref:FUSC family protein n=1 Tax=Variovorax sp. W6 TaxID=3093895 RepID=UPI003D80989D